MLLPTPGIQLVSLTNVADAASMLAAVPGNPAAVRQHYNLTSDRAITHEGAQRCRVYNLQVASTDIVVERGTHYAG